MFWAVYLPCDELSNQRRLDSILTRAPTYDNDTLKRTKM
jgi:hypothetical protein